ncbi:serine protease inhibitor-like [Maniola jurtina]|uniref:serine protease inhibitor-like n=1 Tax=Maniola jurtina TaxID=191418 RepID=UPI001E6863A0|nr:serine protease inhibitor-like [Maniola jurtina]
MAKILFLLFSAFIPYVLTQCTLETAEPRFKRSVYEFSIELLTRLAQEKEIHFVSSTLSTWTLLSSTSLGAADATLAEMRQVLKLHKLKCFNYKYLELAKSITVNNETDVVVERSSAIFVDDKVPILESFKRKIRTAAATFESRAFDDAESAAQRINNFVSYTTHEVIDEIVSPADLEDVFLIIIDAIFFKGTWKTPFPYENTDVGAFYNERGAQVGQVNSMFVTASFNYREAPKLKAEILEIPYGSGARYSMLVFLPLKDESVYTVIDKLKLVSLKTIQNLFDEVGPTQLAVSFPRFKITSDHNNLKELLEDMGLKTMFDSDKAQFPNLSDYPLYVSNFIQKADIEVTEEGTVAAAVTEEEFSFRSGPRQFNVNKPFLFMIVDKKVEVPLFVGAYSKPSVF